MRRQLIDEQIKAAAVRTGTLLIADLTASHWREGVTKMISAARGAALWSEWSYEL